MAVICLENLGRLQWCWKNIQNRCLSVVVRGRSYVIYLVRVFIPEYFLYQKLEYSLLCRCLHTMNNLG